MNHYRQDTGVTLIDVSELVPIIRALATGRNRLNATLEDTLDSALSDLVSLVPPIFHAAHMCEHCGQCTLVTCVRHPLCRCAEDLGLAYEVKPADCDHPADTIECGRCGYVLPVQDAVAALRAQTEGKRVGVVPFYREGERQGFRVPRWDDPVPTAGDPEAGLGAQLRAAREDGDELTRPAVIDWPKNEL